VLHVVGLIHGDMNQVERNDVITSFKNKGMPILVATDVAGLFRSPLKRVVMLLVLILRIVVLH